MPKVVTWSPLDPMLLREGYVAGRRGLAGEANPYMVGTREALAWGIGWAKGQEKQLRVVVRSRPDKPAPAALAPLK
jgi:hypothetical protein